MKIEKFVTVTTDSARGWNPTDTDGWKSSLRDMRTPFKQLNEEVLNLPDDFFYFFFNGEGVVISKVNLMKNSSDRPGDNSSIFYFLRFGIEISGNNLIELLKGEKNKQKELQQQEWTYKDSRTKWKSAIGDNFAYRTYTDDADLIKIFDSIFHEEYAMYSIVFLMPSSAKINSSVKNINDIQFRNTISIHAPQIHGFKVTLNDAESVNIKEGESITIRYRKEGFKEISKTFKAGEPIPSLEPTDCIPEIHFSSEAFTVSDNERNNYRIKKVIVNQQNNKESISTDISSVHVYIEVPKCTNRQLTLRQLFKNKFAILSFLLFILIGTTLGGGGVYYHYSQKPPLQDSMKETDFWQKIIAMYLESDEWGSQGYILKDPQEFNGIFQAMNTYDYNNIKQKYNSLKTSGYDKVGRLQDVIDVIDKYRESPQKPDVNYTDQNKCLTINIDKWINIVEEANKSQPTAQEGDSGTTTSKGKGDSAIHNTTKNETGTKKKHK